MQVRLTHKLANTLDGIDVSGCRVGDVLDLPDQEAAVLIKENWAEAVSTPNPAIRSGERKPYSAT